MEKTVIVLILFSVLLLNINFVSAETEQKIETSDRTGEFFLLYENNQYDFSIDHPPNWTVFDHNEKIDNSIYVVSFSPTDEYDYSLLHIYYTENDMTFSGLKDETYLDKMIDFYKKECDAAPLADDGPECSNFNLVASKSFTKSGYQVYQIGYTVTQLSYDTINDITYTDEVAVEIDQISMGKNTLILKIASYVEEYPLYGNDLTYMVKSFRMLDSSQEQTTYDTSLILQVRDSSVDGHVEVYPQLTYGTGHNLNTDYVEIYTIAQQYVTSVSSNQWSEIDTGSGPHTIWAEVPQLKDVDDPSIVYLNSASDYVNYNVLPPPTLPPEDVSDFDITVITDETIQILTSKENEIVEIPMGVELFIYEMENFGVIKNNGTIWGFEADIKNHGTILNMGTMKTTYDSFVNNTGTISNSGILDFGECNFLNSGTINNYVWLSIWFCDFKNTGTIDNFGTVINDIKYEGFQIYFDNFGIVNNYGIINNTGIIINNAGTINNDCFAVFNGSLEGNPIRNTCIITEIQETTSTVPEEGGGCLIATATYGSELVPQVQLLREIRDNTVLSTASGTSFMTAFNSFYYSFSPTIADLERQNPIFKEAVKVTITPLLSTLSLLQYVDIDSESEMLGYGIAVIMLNIGMYFVGPAFLVIKLRSKIQTIQNKSLC